MQAAFPNALLGRAVHYNLSKALWIKFDPNPQYVQFLYYLFKTYPGMIKLSLRFVSPLNLPRDGSSCNCQVIV